MSTRQGILLTKSIGRQFKCFTVILTALASDIGRLHLNAKVKMVGATKIAVPTRQ
jgi:hypothetical protein